MAQRVSSRLSRAVRSAFRSVGVAATIVGGIMLEVALERLTAPWSLPIPVGTAIVFFWCWRMRFAARITTGALAGLFLDAVSTEPFGTHMIIFLFGALAIEELQRVLLDADSAFVATCVLSALTAGALIATVPLEAAAHAITGSGYPWGGGIRFWQGVYAAAYWSILPPLLIWAGTKAFRRTGRFSTRRL